MSGVPQVGPFGAQKYTGVLKKTGRFNNYHAKCVHALKAETVLAKRIDILRAYMQSKAGKGYTSEYIQDKARLLFIGADKDFDWGLIIKCFPDLGAYGASGMGARIDAKLVPMIAKLTGVSATVAPAPVVAAPPPRIDRVSVDLAAQRAADESARIAAEQALKTTADERTRSAAQAQRDAAAALLRQQQAQRDAAAAAALLIQQQQAVTAVKGVLNTAWAHITDRDIERLRTQLAMPAFAPGLDIPGKKAVIFLALDAIPVHAQKLAAYGRASAFVGRLGGLYLAGKPGHCEGDWENRCYLLPAIMGLAFSPFSSLFLTAAGDVIPAAPADPNAMFRRNLAVVLKKLRDTSEINWDDIKNFRATLLGGAALGSGAIVPAVGMPGDACEVLSKIMDIVAPPGHMFKPGQGVHGTQTLTVKLDMHGDAHVANAIYGGEDVPALGSDVRLDVEIDKGPYEIEVMAGIGGSFRDLVREYAFKVVSLPVEPGSRRTVFYKAAAPEAFQGAWTESSPTTFALDPRLGFTQVILPSGGQLAAGGFSSSVMLPLSDGTEAEFEVREIVVHSGGSYPFTYLKMLDGKWHKYNYGEFVKEIADDVAMSAEIRGSDYALAANNFRFLMFKK